MFLATLVFIPSAFVLISSLQVLWDSADDDPFDESIPDELFRF